MTQDKADKALDAPERRSGNLLTGERIHPLQVVVEADKNLG